MPGAITARISAAVQRPMYIGLADGDPLKAAAIRSMRWYDVIEMYIYKLDTYRRNLKK